MNKDKSNNPIEEPLNVKTYNKYKDGLDNLKKPNKSANELLKDNYTKELADLQMSNNSLTPSQEKRRDFLIQEIPKLIIP